MAVSENRFPLFRAMDVWRMAVLENRFPLFRAMRVNIAEG
jgi:hypothetical protein